MILISLPFHSMLCYVTSGLDPFASQVYISIVNFGSTWLAVFGMDYIGRRTFLLWGGMGMAVSNFIICALFFAADPTGNPQSSGNAVLAFICIFIFHFAISWGPIAWLIPTEIYPVRVRGNGVAMATFADWIANFMISKTVNNMLQPNSFGPGGVFAFFASWAVVMSIWTFLFVRETKGVILERMDLLYTVQDWATLKKYISINMRYTFVWGQKAEELKQQVVFTRQTEEERQAESQMTDIQKV
jgi:hypothetical protein